MEIIKRETQNPHHHGEGFVFDNFSCELYKKRWSEAITSTKEIDKLCTNAPLTTLI